MLTISYEEIINGVEDLLGLKRGTTDVYDWGRFKMWAARRLLTAWEFAPWPDLMLLERRLFRPAIAAHTTDSIASTTAGTQVFYWPTQKYYVAMATTTSPPLNSSGVFRSTVWGELKPIYSGSDWAVGTTYNGGDVVKWNQTGEYYQSLSGSNVGNYPSDGTYWYQLPSFDRYVALDQSGMPPLGTVFEVYDKSPRLVRNARELKWTLDGSYVRVLDEVPYVWVWFRKRAPLLFGDTWASGSYAVGDQVYYETATLNGDFYKCIATATTQAPTDTAKWEKIEIPRIFYRYLVQGIYTDSLPGDGQNEKRNAEEAVAQRLLADQHFVMMQQNQQAPGMSVLTR